MTDFNVPELKDEWKVTVEELCARYSSNVTTGLTTIQAKLNEKQYGKNECKKAQKSGDADSTTIPVWRDGQVAPLPHKKLVVGDIVELLEGVQVPADMRIIVANEMLADVSQLTGAFEKKKLSVDSTDENPLETGNLVFFWDKITRGSGKAIVIAVGKNTIAGKLMEHK